MRHGESDHLRSLEIPEITTEAVPLGEGRIRPVERQLRRDKGRHGMPAVFHVDAWSGMIPRHDDRIRLESLDAGQYRIKSFQGSNLLIEET